MRQHADHRRVLREAAARANVLLRVRVPVVQVEQQRRRAGVRRNGDEDALRRIASGEHEAEDRAGLDPGAERLRTAHVGRLRLQRRGRRRLARRRAPPLRLRVRRNHERTDHHQHCRATHDRSITMSAALNPQSRIPIAGIPSRDSTGIVVPVKVRRGSDRGTEPRTRGTSRNRDLDGTPWNHADTAADTMATSIRIASSASPKKPPRRCICSAKETASSAISGYTVRPPEARSKPKVSAFINARFDKIEALKPDLILAFSDLQADIAAELIRRGYPVMTFNQRSVAEILRMIRTVGALVGRQDAAEALAASLERGWTTSGSVGGFAAPPSARLLRGVGRAADLRDLLGGRADRDRRRRADLSGAARRVAGEGPDRAPGGRRWRRIPRSSSRRGAARR